MGSEEETRFSFGGYSMNLGCLEQLAFSLNPKLANCKVEGREGYYKEREQFIQKLYSFQGDMNDVCMIQFLVIIFLLLQKCKLSRLYFSC